MACLSALPAQALDICGPGAIPGSEGWLLLVLLLPALLILLYIAGVWRLWRKAGPVRGLGWREAGCFVAAALLLFATMLWPLRDLSQWSLAAHTAQHMLLLAVVPPLWMAGRPMAAIAWSMPGRWAQVLRRFVQAFSRPLGNWLGLAGIAHGATMVVWHIPAVMAQALTSPALHMLMHGCYLVSGFWFWLAVVRRIREPVAGVGSALLALVGMMMVMGFIGALLTFSPRPLYSDYLVRAALAGFDPMRDQQIAGLLMWVPASVPYVVAAAWLLAQGLRRLERDDALRIN